jgi:hypothetical protein
VNYLIFHVIIGHEKTTGKVLSRVGSVVLKWEFCVHYKYMNFMHDSLVGETSAMSKLFIGFYYFNHNYIPILGPISIGEAF